MISLDTLPHNPGVYLFKDNNNSIIYIGKAKDIKKRVSSYFHKQLSDIKTKALLEHVNNLDIIVTANEVEALVLENTLIKKHQPKYNVRLRDAKNFAFIHIPDERFPRLIIARRRSGKGNYYGPFVSASERDETLNFLHKAFSFRRCKKLPKKPCLRFHIKLCSAPCNGSITEQEYQHNIEKAKRILIGKTDDLINELTQKMHGHKEQQQYEQALVIRNQIDALCNLKEHQNMRRNRVYNEDIINYIVKNNTVYLMVFNIYKGTLANKDEYVFENTKDFLDDFIIQYYDEKPIPKEVILPRYPDKAIGKYLTYQNRKKVTITVPQRGGKKQLLQLAHKNIEVTFLGDEEKLSALKKLLQLHEQPEVIECVDISHISGTATVGSLAVFRHGKPDKSSYRRFKIRTVKGIDDYAGIAEVIRRRYTRLKNEKRELPNLIIIDGGKGQLNVALQVLTDLDMQIPLIAIAKQADEIFIPGLTQPVNVTKNDKALHIVKEIRDEAHRFAITYHRLLRKKEMLT